MYQIGAMHYEFVNRIGRMSHRNMWTATLPRPIREPDFAG